MENLVFLVLLVLSLLCVSKQLPCQEGCRCHRQGICDKCVEGYYMAGNECRRCSSNCLACSSYKSCEKCNAGYYVHSFFKNKQECQPCSPGCLECKDQTNCVQCGSGYFINHHTCKKCPEGYIENGKTCVPLCPENCIFCSHSNECVMCKPRYFSILCSQNCAAGCNEKICDIITGNCTCTHDFFETDYIGIGNRPPKARPECNSDCFTDYDIFFKGFCIKCEDGSWGNGCNNVCPDTCRSCLSDLICTNCKNGYYGSSCERRCSRGCAADHCQQETGICLNGCKSNYKGDLFCAECMDGRYGGYCNMKCSENCSQNICNRHDGQCLQGCVRGYYGTHCMASCSANCSRNQCHLNGTCVDCIQGYFGELCEKPCPTNCLNSSCTRTGVCISCIFGYVGDSCIEKSEEVFINGPQYNNSKLSFALFALIPLICSCAFILLVFSKRTKCKRRTSEIAVSFDQVRKEERSTSDEQNRSLEQENFSGKHVLHFAAIRSVGSRNKVSSSINLHNDTHQSTIYESGTDYSREERGPVSCEENKKENVDFTTNETDDNFRYANSANFINRRVSIDQLREYLRRKTMEEYIGEFQELPTGLIKPYQESQKKDNISKCRYAGIYPYDSSRVILKDTESDFINASYVQGYKRQKCYIASQGPTSIHMGADFGAFWNMVYQEKVHKIVMLTNPVEFGVQKCDKYWPDKGECNAYGGIEVTCLSEMIYPHFAVRKFSIKKDEMRTLYHMQYTDWPDKRIPQNIPSVIQFWERVTQILSNEEEHILVHCSAGVGRTGTFIALDILADEGMAEGQVDVFKCVRNLREDRVNLVQTVSQYKFLHEVLVQLFERKTTERTLRTDDDDERVDTH